MPAPDSPIRDPQITRLQRVRNLLTLATCVALFVGFVVAVRERLLETSTDTPTEPVIALPSTRPAVIETTNPVSGFVHPGVLVSVGQLEYVRNRVLAGDQPWTGAFNTMARSDYANLKWQPNPREVVECGPYSNPDRGCTDEWRDAVAAYTQALMWYFTGDRAHADKAIEIIDAWASTLRQHTHSNAPIQTGWSAATLVRAAELVKHSYDGWPADSLARTEEYFRTVILPVVADGGAVGSGGNWDLIILNAAIGIAVFLDDRPLFDSVIGQWRERLPGFIYLTSDGPYPVAMPGTSARPVDLINYWYGQETFVDGLTQETCRDLGHTGWGLEALAQIAETAWLQGVDLYAEAQPRLVASLEFHAGFALGDEVPGWLCGGQLTSVFDPIPEIAFNHYHNRLGIEMPRTQQLLDARRPQLARFFFAWGTLTTAHAG